jgi:integrase
MPKRKSFAKQIQEMKAEPGRRVTLAVPGADGLYVRATQKSKSFTIIAREQKSKKQVWATVPVDGIDIDNITDLELDAVRQTARAAIANIKRGVEPFPPEPAGPQSLQTIGDNFMLRYVRGRALASADEIERQLKVYVYPRLGNTPINDIRRSDIAELLDEIEDKNGSTQADRVLATLRKLFNWHCTRDDEFVSPVVMGMARTIPAERRRERVMSDEEIRAMWPILGDMGAYGALLKILLLTGQRLDKVRSMKWADLEDGIWTIPQVHKREKANGGKLPLAPAALEVLDGLDEIVGNPFVFASGRTDHHINSFPKDKTRLDAALGEALGRDLEPWVLHSLRHTAKTLMARAKVSEFDSERVLGHVIPGIAATYNHHAFTEEKGAALERLAAELGRIHAPPPAGKVIKLEAAR